MLVYAALSFAVAALGGAVMATLHFRGKSWPRALTVLHGLFAATGLVLLIVAVVGNGGSGLATASLVVFLVAALGGFYLVSHSLRSKPLPSPVVVIHALAAVTGFVLLLLVVL